MLDGHADFNGDGKSDLLWRDTSGELVIWQMNGLAVAGSDSLGVLPTSWIVQDVDRDVLYPSLIASVASFAAGPGPTLDAGVQADDGNPDHFRLYRDAAELKVELNGVYLYSAAFDSVTNLTITGSTDDDTLTVDLSGGNPIPVAGLLYDGAGPGDFDVLNIIGASGGSLVYTSSGASSGTIDVGGGLISYNNLEPIYDDVVLAERVFVFGPEAGTIHVDVGATRTVVSSPFSELVDFVNPTGTVTILTGAGDYNIVVTGNPAYELVIDSAGGNNKVTSAVAVGAVNFDDLADRWDDRGFDDFRHVAGKPALFSVNGVNFRLGGDGDRREGDVRHDIGDWLISEGRAKGASDARVKAADDRADHASDKSEAKSQVNWNDSFAGLAAPFSGAGNSRGTGKSNLAEFEQQKSTKNSGAEPVVSRLAS